MLWFSEVSFNVLISLFLTFLNFGAILALRLMECCHSNFVFLLVKSCYMYTVTLKFHAKSRTTMILLCLFQVRGAPAIAIVGALSLVVELLQQSFSSVEELLKFITEKLDYLTTARPTAVNISETAKDLVSFVTYLSSVKSDPEDIKIKVIEEIEGMLAKDVSDNQSVGRHGADHMVQLTSSEKLKVLTHCNTGSLATAGYGTALGVIRKLYEQERIEHVFCTETRPYNQGSRLTAYELVYENIPSTLVADSMVSLLMKTKGVHVVVVGADRVVANGDTANKIGTYQIAISG